MTAPSANPAGLFRELREQRRLTLRAAARLLHTSAPVLSRKERGQAPIERRDIELAIAGYGLDPWETFMLWSAGGFAPSATRHAVSDGQVRHIADQVLGVISFPAFLTDDLLFVRAWNRGIEAIWHPSAAPGPIHIVDDLFSERIREKMGVEWESYVLRALRIFRTQTWPVATDPRFLGLLDKLEAAHGPKFVAMWNRAQIEDEAGVDLAPVIVRHDSSRGPIDYIVMQATWATPGPWMLSTYLPVGADNLALYEAMMGDHPEIAGGAPVFFAGGMEASQE